MFGLKRSAFLQLKGWGREIESAKKTIRREKKRRYLRYHKGSYQKGETAPIRLSHAVKGDRQIETEDSKADPKWLQRKRGREERDTKAGNLSTSRSRKSAGPS